MHNIEAVMVNGSMTQKDRTAALKAFKSPNSTARVIILSQVASAGLNLAEADVVIFLVGSALAVIS